MKASILYISYDGMLDPLGQSQVIPYLVQLSKHFGGIILLSFEKKSRPRASKVELATKLSACGIEWIPIAFTEGSGSVRKLWDLSKMIIMTLAIVGSRKVRLIHARGHLGALSASLIKLVFPLKLLFDFRGLWVDERVDKGGWKLERKLDRFQFNLFKRFEHALLSRADHIVVLTERVVTEIMRISGRQRSDITVVPCCADFDHFKLVSSESRSLAKRKFSWLETDLVIGYLGSVGQMYMVDEFALFARQCRNFFQSVKVLAITPDGEAFRQLVSQSVDGDAAASYVVVSANREEVPEVAAAFDVLVSFIRPSYARQAASPTKIAESFALGIPVVTNHGIGDLSNLIPAVAGGLVVDLGDKQATKCSKDEIDTILKINGEELRCRARIILGLEVAIERYSQVYKRLGLDYLPTKQG